MCNIATILSLYEVIITIILYTQEHVRACSNKKGVNNSIRPTILVHLHIHNMYKLKTLKIVYTSIMWTQLGQAQSVLIREVSAIGRCPLREVSLYIHTCVHLKVH